MANRVIEKYNLSIQTEQEIEMSVAATILGVTVEDNVLKILVDHESAPTRTRKRSFYIVRAGSVLPDGALRYVGQFARDNELVFLYSDTDDTPAAFAPDVPLVHYSDFSQLRDGLEARIAALESELTAAKSA